MIVYIFNSEFFKKIFLPVRVAGIYPIYMNENKILVNIEAVDGKWMIKTIDSAKVMVNNAIVADASLNSENTYIISTNKFSVYMIANPLYVERTSELMPSKKELVFGSSSQCDICYSNGVIKDCEYKLSCDNNNIWTINSMTKNVYLNDKLVTSSVLRVGDIIFCFGIKIIFLGQYFIIVPHEKLVINNRSFSTVSVVASPVTSKDDELNDISDDTPLYDKKQYFMKAPRFVANPLEEEIIIDSPPPEEKREESPFILTVGPQITMMSMSLLSVSSTVVDFVNGTADTMRFVISMGTVIAMLSGIMVWPLIIRIYQKKSRRRKNLKRIEKYKKYLIDRSEKIHSIKLTIKEAMIQEFPDLSVMQGIIDSRKAGLWKKNIDDDDFLEVSLGYGKISSKLKVSFPEERFSLDDEDPLVPYQKKVVEDAKYIDDAPFTFSFTSNNSTAIVGEKVLCDKLLDDIFLQIMTFHPYSDLKIVVFTNQKNVDRWEYLKILPHCWDNQHVTRYFATTVEEFNEMTADLDSTFESRKSSDDSEKLEDDGGEEELSTPYKSYKPYYIIFTDSIEQIRNTSLIKKVLSYRKNLGFSILIQNDRLSTLPDQTHTFISVNKEVSGLFTNKLDLNDKSEFKIDFTKNVDMYHCSQVLANIPILLEKSKYELPKSLSFLEMFRVGRVEQLNSLEKWKNNNPVNSLSVPIGVDQNGEIFKMDLHEKVYGPHGLVAGTTGSGKSEWIITFILSLAVNFNPDEVQFVLIDYKGGGLAMSFENKELGIKLPHLAGTITNLDKSAINRSIASIESELKRRQSIFNDAREKLKEGQMDIYKYQQFYRKGDVDIPLSHLFIICDEFAELKQQQPEFMDQLISTSRIGRSLGVHLILATQKPSGVVNDQIWSNSRFKVCLRVQDKADSQEILKKPDAAYLKQVGAFYLEVGSDEYYNLGQSAWAGAKYTPSDVVMKAIDQPVQYINNIGKIINYFDIKKEDQSKKDESQGEELLNVVKYIDTISKEENFTKQQLWLPNIPEYISLNEIKERYGFKPKKLDFTTVIGEYDEPRKQEQNILTINLSEGNVAIVGQPGAGKELLLSTIIFSSISEHTPQEINYYILDFGAETLRKFSKFPHVGEVVFQDDMERVGGVIQLIFDEIAKRKELFQDYNGSLEYYNKKSGKVLPLICLVINAFDVFGEVLSRVVESFNSLFRDAPRYGIIFVLSASAQNTFRPRILQYFNRFILMNLQDESQYRNLSNCRKGLLPSNLYGRGICKTNDDDDSYCEFQTAYIADGDKELTYLNKVSDYLSKNYKARAKKIMTIPDNITSDDLSKYLTTISDIPIGYNFYEKDIAKLDLSNVKIYPIITKDLKVNIKFIYALANLLSKLQNTVVRVVDVSKIFDKPILDIKLFQDDLKVVFAALSKDTLERKDTQPLAINIILGAASIKNTLDKLGNEYANKMFTNMINSRQNLYFLVDEYKNFRTLKLQPWYNTIDTSNGIWLGEGIDSQSVLVSNELSQEDKKYKYEGMAYVVRNGTYSLVKTMMDGDD